MTEETTKIDLHLPPTQTMLIRFLAAKKIAEGVTEEIYKQLKEKGITPYKFYLMTNGGSV